MEKAEERIPPMRSLDLAKKSPKKAKILRIRQILTNFSLFSVSRSALRSVGFTPAAKSSASSFIFWIFLLSGI